MTEDDNKPRINPFAQSLVCAAHDLPVDQLPPREWAWNNWLPYGVVTGFTGEGGVGKSLLAQQLCTAYSLGIPFLGEPTRQGEAEKHPKALYITTEDEYDEGMRRQAAINNTMGITNAELGELMRIHMIAQDVEICAAASDGSLVETPLFRRLVDLINTLSAGLVVLDILTDYWGGSEINRQHVNKFVKLYLNKIAQECRCAILVLYHPSKAGMNDGTGSSGSTAWNGSFRSRWYMVGDKDDKNVRKLMRVKANYAPKAEEFVLWENWAYRHLPNHSEEQKEATRVEFFEWCHAVLSIEHDGLHKMAKHIDAIASVNGYSTRQIMRMAKDIIPDWSSDSPMRLKHSSQYFEYWLEKGLKQTDPILIGKRTLS